MIGTGGSSAMASGRLRIYLGAAPGVGKTYDMLQEAHRRRQRGTDVVVGFVEPHGRVRTADLVTGLEVIPRRRLRYRGRTFTEMDLDAVLARAPQVALVDELAHTNVPGSRNPKRWQDIHELTDAGITVLSTVNIQHLESLNDVVEQITGVPQQETVPDTVVRAADQVELVDMTAEALRRRLVHGNVYPPERIEPALDNYFRVGNLTALRELALLWLADKVDEQLDRYRAAYHITGTWEAHERVVVGLTGGPEGETLIRRAARIAARSKGSDLLAVHVSRDDALTRAQTVPFAQRQLVQSLGGTYHQVSGTSVPTALLEFARAVNATQLVLGASRRGRLAQLFSRGVGITTIAHSGHIDVHLVTHEEAVRGGHRWRSTTRPHRETSHGGEDIRALAGLTGRVLGGAPPLTAVLDQVRATWHLSAVRLLQRRPGTSVGPDQQRAPAAWRVVASAGTNTSRAPADGDTHLPIDDEFALVLVGAAMAAPERRAVESFAALAAAALRAEHHANAAAGPRLDEPAARPLLDRLEHWPPIEP
jgi:two-component system sensor histidine kinase KdpD